MCRHWLGFARVLAYYYGIHFGACIFIVGIIGVFVVAASGFGVHALGYLSEGDGVCVVAASAHRFTPTTKRQRIMGNG